MRAIFLTTRFSKSIASDIEMKEHTFIKIFNIYNKLKFYLRSYHKILGNDSLKSLEAVIDFKYYFMIIKDSTKIKFKQLVSISINTFNIKRNN